MPAVGMSDILIANMALNRIGSTQSIQAFTDQTNEAQQLNIWYFQDRDAELTDWPWNFAYKYVALNLVSTIGIPANPEWLYSYRMPADCLSVRRIVCGQVVTNAQASPPLTTAPNSYQYNNLVRFRQDGDPLPQPFEEGVDETGRLIYTDAPYAWIRYTFLQENASLYPRDFADMLAWRVAKDLYGLARADARRDYCEKMYEKTKQMARARDLNDSQNDQPFVDYNSESIRARWNG